ncbi:hypothetical protein [uncultured Ruegeria sp.]|uniref:hypothetical protein n=1 Tax=uncultured Ruegeria sp. TaxID=259304 RepID=UPI002618F0E2|nr:hypothetical protein [uncultured Ruegeria sp.]
MARQPDRVKQMIPDYASVLVSAPGIEGGFDGDRVLRACGFDCSTAAAGFGCVAEGACFGDAALGVRGAGFARVDSVFSCVLAALDRAEGALAAESAGRARGFFTGADAPEEDAAGVAFRATGLTLLAPDTAGFVSVFGCGAGFGAGLAFTAVSTLGVAAARGFAENSAGLGLGSGFGVTATTFFTGFFATAVFWAAEFDTRGAVALALTVVFLTGFAGADAAECSACTGAMGSSNAERATICMIFIWLTIA